MIPPPIEKLDLDNTLIAENSSRLKVEILNDLFALRPLHGGGGGSVGGKTPPCLPYSDSSTEGDADELGARFLICSDFFSKCEYHYFNQ